MKTGFAPIQMNEYVKKHIKSNPGTSRKEIETGLKAALKDYKSGVKCNCGNPIWVIGSAIAGNACFSCITGTMSPLCFTSETMSLFII